MTGKRFNAHDQGLQKDKYAQDLWFLESSPVLWLFQSKTMQYNGWQTPKFSAGTARKRVYSRRFLCLLCLLSLALGGRETLQEMFFWGLRRRVGEDVFGFNFILGLQKAPNLEKAKDDSSSTSLTCRLCSVAFHQLSPPEALWELRLYAPVMVKTSIAPGMV